MAKQKKIIELEVQSSKAVKGLNQTSTAMQGVGTASKGVATGFKGIAASMKAMGIGLLIGLLAALFEAFKRNQEISDLVARGMDLLQKVVNVVVKVFMGALKVVDALTLGLFNLAGASDTASASLQRQRNEARLLQAEEQLVQLQFQKRAEVQRQIRDDESRSVEERQAANIELGKILEEQHTEEMNRAKKILEVRENELAANSSSVELQEQVIAAKTKVAEIDERITSQRSEMLVNINSLNRENKELAKTSGGVASAVREEVKSYEDLNREMKTALGLDQTVESIIKRIADARKIRAEEIKKEEQELKALEETTKKFRKSNSSKEYKRLLDEEKKFKQELFRLEVEADHIMGKFEDNRFDNVFNQEIKEAKEKLALNKKAQEEELKVIDNYNKSKKRRVKDHNDEVAEEVKKHNEKMLKSEEAFNQLIEDARQMARNELDVFLGTAEEKELAALKEQFDKRMLMVEGDIASQLRLQDWFGQQIIDIKKKYAEEEAKIEKDKDDEIFALKTQNMEKSFAIASSLTTSLGKLAGDNVKAQKNAALLGITIDTAASVSSAIRGAIEAAKGNPVLTPLLIAELLAIVFGGMAQAKGILSSVPGGSDSGANLQGLQAGIGVGGGDVPRLPTDNNIDLDMPPVQAFVVESNVTGKQVLQNELEIQATL